MAYFSYVFILAKSLHIPLLYWDAIKAVSLVNIIGMIPLSLGGLGIVEYSYIYFLTNSGLSDSQAGAMVIILFVSKLIYGIVGGAIYSLSEVKISSGLNDEKGLETDSQVPAE